MSRKRKYQKTQGYWVYSLTAPNGMVYFGVSKNQPCRRWQKEKYKGKSVYKYIEEFGWENIEKQVIKDSMSKAEAYALEDYYITNTPCINKHRSGLIESDKKQYMKEYDKQRNSTTERKEHMKQYDKQRNSTTERKEYMKQYRKEHKEEMKQHQKRYREKKKN